MTWKTMYKLENIEHFNKGSIDGYMSEIIRVAPTPVVLGREKVQVKGCSFSALNNWDGGSQNYSSTHAKKGFNLRQVFLSHGCKCYFNILTVPAQNGRWTKYNTDLFKLYVDSCMQIVSRTCGYKQISLINTQFYICISCLDPHHKVGSFQKNVF